MHSSLCPGKHSIFGRVCRGMEIIKRLGSVQTDNNDRYPSHLLYPHISSTMTDCKTLDLIEKAYKSLSSLIF